MTDYRNDIQQAVNHLRKGGIILYPTDTVWGIGCDATSSEAVRKVFALKRRADSKALITLVGSIDALYQTVECVPEVAEQLIEVSDTPVTIVYDHGTGVAPELLAEDSSIAVRVTKEPFSRQLCQALRRPLVSTSANISGQPAPRTYHEIKREILDGVDYVCQSRHDESADGLKPSMIIKIKDNGEFKVLRK